MKPRIKAGWYHAFGFGVDIWGWWCEGFGAREFGMTPSGAYQVWYSKQILLGKVVTAERAQPKWWEVLCGVR